MGIHLFSRVWVAAAAAGSVFLGAASAGIAQEPPGEWNMTVGARESGEFSRLFNGVPEPDLMMDNVSFTLGYQSRTERSIYGLFGRAGYNNYREGDNRSQINYGAGFSWTYAPSERLNTTLTFGADQGFQAETLSNLGVLAPGFDSSAAQASWGLQYHTSPRTTLSTSVYYDYVRFVSDQSTRGSQIVVGQPPFRQDFPRLFPERGGNQPGVPLPDAEGGIIDILATEGFLFGTSGSHSGGATFGLSRTVSEYSSLGFDLMGGYRTIDRGDAIFRQEGGQGALRFWAQRRAGASSTLLGFYTVSRSLIMNPATTIQTLSGGYSYLPATRNISVRLSGGASYYVAENGTTSLTPIVDGSFNAGLTRSTQLSLLYQRQFAESLGYGTTLLIDYASVSLTQAFGSKVNLILLAGGTFGSDPLREGSRYDAVQVGGTLTYQIVESFAVGASYFALKTEQLEFGPPSDTERNLASVFITYTTTWR